MSEALQKTDPDIRTILYEVARKLEHATGIDGKELDEMKRVAFETFLKIGETLGANEISNRETAFPIPKMYHLAFKISLFEPAIIAHREEIAPLLKTLTEISGRLPG